MSWGEDEGHDDDTWKTEWWRKEKQIKKKKEGFLRTVYKTVRAVAILFLK
jgi:hypothetical protein